MANSFKPIVLLIFLSAMCFLGIRSVSGNNNDKENKYVKLKVDTAQVVSTVHEIHDIVENEILIDTTQFGVCDTCRTSFTTVLEDNRKLCDLLFEQNLILYDRLNITKRLNDSLANVEILLVAEMKKRKAVNQQRL
ncbi:MULTISPECIES: hypothetical protein [unclassified Arcicella]|uniref:hypothetical protein n=1 Tax=unclassified Arcicella TaxID=2644986 RepID=UPI0028641EF3|nr:MULTISPECIES: hypothetical protein [unclassified Arcicella]MDR6564957.1 hypothetical protein [Arcicella sp. BE51]MDR6814747.1 hypothetical protein [Arcicella sp. BE140]MDR6826193.1 hypothetical protein [Arcicella sp. BE139]